MREIIVIKNIIIITTLSITALTAIAQVANDADGLYDNTTLVDTNNNSTSTSTVTTNNNNTSTNTSTSASTVDSTATNTNTNTNTNTSTSDNTNTNYNVNSGEQTINNNNVNSGEMTYNNNNTSTSTNTNNNTNVNTNKNTNTSTSTSNNTNTNTSTNVNTNKNTNTSTSTSNNNNVNSSTNNNTNVNKNENSGTMTNINKNDTTVKSPPPTAVAPSMMSGGGNDLCTTGVSGAVQTQILGISGGSTVRDLNCERLKNAKVLYDMGMKVAAVTVMCQDRRIFDAMWHAGTPCPFEGKIGEAAKRAWTEWPDRIPKHEITKEDDSYQKILIGIGLAAVFGVVF
jgi:hypothetical protein